MTQKLDADELDKITCTNCEYEFLAEYADKEEWEYCPHCGETLF
ncbi:MULTISPECIES: hypothetical protein [Acinetobacter]|uniref:Uncharacterized protein n=1 Tax=Acinetobacter higginsii TaxID=70347 RepID=N9STI9_9GAMM|nr:MULTISPECIES: hypothetical protein [Acinetobacter]ENX57976.1 hypothetical protein F902_02376 [Acinetobacter higginsii]